MRKWGILITLFYVLVLLVLLLPAAIFLSGSLSSSSELFKALRDVSSEWLLWLPIAVLVAGEALLLFISVDTSQKRLKPRSHVLVSVTVTALLLGLLTLAVVFCVGSAIKGDKFGGTYLESTAQVLGCWLLLWILWFFIFYGYARNSSPIVTRALSWLLKGSVLEILVAVPCHIIVRRRQDCSAPVVTSFGITTGLAIMLLSFGPSILLLYKKRLDAYPPPKPL